jgi:predicted nucleotidyltransferase
MKLLKEIMYNKNPLLILSYLSKNRSQENISAHIAKDLGLGVGSVHQILKAFEEQGIVQSKRFGKTLVYELDKNSPLVKSFRVFDNLLNLDLLFSNLKRHCRKIILFGSCATGTDSDSSDIDIFVVTDMDDKDNVYSIISAFHSEREINPIIVDTVELMDMENKDRVFYNEIMKGIEVWEGTYGHN